MTCQINFMCGRQKKLKIKNKNPCHCHVMESGESDGIWGIFEESFLYKERIKKKKITWNKTKSTLYYMG